MGCLPQIEKLGTVEKGEVGSGCWVVQPQIYSDMCVKMLIATFFAIAKT